MLAGMAVVLALCLFGAVDPAVAQSGASHSVSDSAPDFEPTLAALRRAVAQRDANALLALVHPDFRVLGRPYYGLPGFREYWLQSSERDVWTCLADALRQPPLALPGGGLCLWTPSAAVYPALPSDFDSAELVEGDGLRAEPATDAPLRVRLPAGALLRYAPREPPMQADGRVWRRMLWGPTAEDAGASGPQEGWVEQRRLRSPLTLRFHFAPFRGRWLMDGSSDVP